VVGLVVVVARKMDLHALRGALVAADMAWVGAAAVLSLAMLAAKVGYWRTILSPVARVPYGRMLWYTVSSYGASVILPMRGGEAVRVLYLSRQEGIPLGVIGSALAFEKVADMASLVLLPSPLPWLYPNEAWLRRFQVITPFALTGGLLAALCAWQRLAAWASRLRIFDTARQPLSAFLFVLASWVADATLILTVLCATGLPASPAAALLVLMAANLASAIPTAPGDVGALELGVAFALTRLGAAEARAAAFALLYHGVQLATLLGAWGIGAGMVLLGGARARRRPTESSG